MVLDDDDWNETPPPSDNDAYSGDERRFYNIDMSNLPRPMPIFGPLFGYNNNMLQKAVLEQANTAAKMMKRPLTDEEMAAFTFWNARQISIASYSLPIGIGGGLWRAYNSAAMFRFPFFQPNPDTFSQFSFPHKKVELLRGSRSVAAWHLLRGAAYTLNGSILAQLLFASYAMSVVAVGELSDPRLKDFVSVMRQRAAQRKGALQQQVPGQGQQRAPVPAQRQGPGQGYPPIPPPSQQSQVDDASPTGGMWMGEDDAKEDTQWKEPSSPQTRQQQQQQQEPQWKTPPPSRSAPASTQQAEPQSQAFDIWDDASPTAAPQNTSSQPQRQPGGSAWDRIRRGEKPAAPAADGAGKWDSVRRTRGSEWALGQERAQRESRQGSAPSESYSFSKVDEERQFAREEAQKEFDERVEKERQGGDFSAERGDQRRW